MSRGGEAPIIYELNTWVWLQQLSAKYKRRIDLSSVPSIEWDALSSLRCNAVWLMGVWQRSPVGRRIALNDQSLMAEFHKVLPDLTEDDVPGSAYCIKSYQVDSRLGSLGAARSELASRGLSLILDYVPNHVAPDHAWVSSHPEYFIQGNQNDLKYSPQAYFEANGKIIACGRDPYFPAWTDTAQLNAFAPRLRQAAMDTLQDIAAQCDGVRCDMAMLLLNAVFSKTWGAAAGPLPASEYWKDTIASVKQQHPNFLFMAEAYWDREWDLQQLGFDYCYDKRLCDRLMHETAPGIRSHLQADTSYQQKLVRFLENHDEQRAAAVLPLEKHRAAATAIASLPGAILYHQGEFSGAQIRIPVQLARGPVETPDAAVEALYRFTRDLTPQLKNNYAQWMLCAVEGWPDNSSADNLLAWGWQNTDHKFLIVINYSDVRAEGRVRLPWTAATHFWILHDLANNEIFERDGNEMQQQGLYVARDAWGVHVFQCTAKSAN